MATTSVPTNHWAALIGRVLLALIFVTSGWSKIGGFEGTAGYIASKGLPMPQVIAALTIAVELLGGILLILGWKARWAGLVLAVFSLAAAFIFHAYWAVPDAQRMGQYLNFWKNITIAGGMLMVFAFGAGRLSLDKED